MRSSNSRSYIILQPRSFWGHVTHILGKVVTYCEWFLPIKWYIPLNMWSREFTQKIKSFIFPLSQSVLSSNMSEWRQTARSSQSLILLTSQWGSLVISCDKLNMLYIHLQKTYPHQLGKVLTYCDSLAPLKLLNPLITLPMWDHLTILKICISTFTYVH